MLGQGPTERAVSGSQPCRRRQLLPSSHHPARADGASTGDEARMMTRVAMEMASTMDGANVLMRESHQAERGRGRKGG